MKIIKATHRTENEQTIVNLRFKTRDQLLDPDDPCPLQEKELTQEAEDAIVNNVFAERLKKPVTLEIQVPGVPDSGSATENLRCNSSSFQVSTHRSSTRYSNFYQGTKNSPCPDCIQYHAWSVLSGYASIYEDWITTIPGQFIGESLLL